MRIHQQADDEEQRPVRFSLCRSVQRDPQLKCLTLSLLIVISLASVAWCRLATGPSTPRGPGGGSVGQCQQHLGYVYLPIGLFCILYLVYLGECWHSSTHVSFRFPVGASAIYQQIRAMRLSPPIVWWRAVCYHYDRRLRQVMRYRRGDAYTSSQVFYERVNSQVTTTVFDYTRFGVIDASKRLVHLEKHPATKIRFSRKFSFACPLAEESHRQQRNEFLEEHQRIDDYLEFTEGLDLLNVRFDDQTVALSNPCHRPWYLYRWVFWAASLLLLSYPLRLIIGYKTAHVHYQVHKIFGVDRGPEFMTRILVRGDPGGQGVNGQLETAIRHNLSLAPSYAEALQINQRRPRFFLDGDFPSYGSIPLLPLGDRKSSSSSAVPLRGDGSTLRTGNHVSLLPVADGARSTTESRVTRCVVSIPHEQNGSARSRTLQKNQVDVAAVENRKQERRNTAASSLTSATDDSDESRRDVTSQHGNIDGEDVGTRTGNDRTVARGQMSPADENVDDGPQQRRRRSRAEAKGDCAIRTKTLPEMTAEVATIGPEIDRRPVEEAGEEEEEKEEEEADGEGNESSDFHLLGGSSRSFEVKKHLDSFESPLELHLNRHNANASSLESPSVSRLSKCHAVNPDVEPPPPPPPGSHLLRSEMNSGWESPPKRPPSNPDDDDLNLLDLVDESPPSYEDALRMRRFVLPPTTGSGQLFRNQAPSSVNDFDEDLIVSPDHLSPDYALADYSDANPSRSRAALVIQVMETSL